MNICFLCHNICSHGGTERVVSNLSEQLSNIGHDCFALSMGKEEALFFDFSALVTIEYLHTEGNKLYVMHNRVKKIRDFLKKNAIDVLVTVGCHLNYYGWRTKGSHKWFAWEQERFGFNNSLYVRVSRLIGVKKADRIIVLTEYDKKHFVSKWKKSDDKVVVIPNSTDVFYEKEGPGLKNVLAVGRLWDIKQFDLLIKAWAGISDKVCDWTLTIVGEGTERNKLESLLEEYKLNNVFLPGVTTDVASYYRSADIFAVTSVAEGFCLVLLEAMAHSLPVVGFYSDGGVSGLVDKRNGILVEQGEVKSLSKVMSELMNDEEKRKNMGRASYNKSLKYTNEQVIEMWRIVLGL